MDTQEIYELTPLGQAELHSSATTLSPEEIAVLVRFDGNLTLQQVQASLSPAASKSFDGNLRALLQRRLLAPVELDPFASRFHAEMGNLAALVGETEADTALNSLQRSGFFVQIARERPDVRKPVTGQPLTVLVVEDEPVLGRFIESYLKLCGMRVRLAGDRAGIVAGLREEPLPDLVLLDVMLPDADGFDVLLRMRQHPVLKRMPVILLTGKATRQAVIKGLLAGADGYLTKPFEPDSVMRAVRTVLGLPTTASGEPANDPWGNADAKPLRSLGTAPSRGTPPTRGTPR
jgi:two-component system, OmpR family, response regulator